jgi:flagellar basal-body rod protein FlgB
MLSGLFNSTTIPVLEQVVGFSEARHEVLAGNLANLDTPGYRIRDLSPQEFQSKLKDAIDARDARPKSQAMSSVGDGRTAELADVRESMKSILFHDQSDVGLEYQIAEITKNQMQHSMAIAIMRSQFSLLQAAISERA